MRAFRIAVVLALAGFTAPALASPLSGRTFEALTIAGAAVTGDKPLTFLIENARVTGSGGCNNYGAPVADRGRIVVERRRNARPQRIAKGPLRIGSVSATRMLCGPGSIQEARFFALLGQARAYRMGQSQLRLFSGGRRPRLLVVLRAAN